MERRPQRSRFDGRPAVTRGPLAADERAELEAYRAAFAELTEVCEAAAHGDLERRVGHLPDAPGVAATRDAVNRLLDLTDAFVREAGASLEAAGEGRFHRAFLVRGMLGAFRDGAQRVNRARIAMRDGAARLAESERDRLALAEQFEFAVLGASEQVAASATELGATAEVLTAAASHAVSEAESAGTTISSLEASSVAIAEVVGLITEVAGQTHLLALNATIEAARSGEAGKGFAVVATEVKHLATQTAEATDRIRREVEAVQQAAADSTAVLEHIVRTVRDMHDQVLAIGTAVNGAGLGVEFTGLSELAEVLRAEVTGFLTHLRA